MSPWACMHVCARVSTCVICVYMCCRPRQLHDVGSRLSAGTFAAAWGVGWTGTPRQPLTLLLLLLLLQLRIWWAETHRANVSATRMCLSHKTFFDEGFTRIRNQGTFWDNHTLFCPKVQYLPLKSRQLHHSVDRSQKCLHYCSIHTCLFEVTLCVFYVSVRASDGAMAALLRPKSHRHRNQTGQQGRTALASFVVYCLCLYWFCLLFVVCEIYQVLFVVYCLPVFFYCLFLFCLLSYCCLVYCLLLSCLLLVVVCLLFVVCLLLCMIFIVNCSCLLFAFSLFGVNLFCLMFAFYCLLLCLLFVVYFVV